MSALTSMKTLNDASVVIAKALSDKLGVEVAIGANVNTACTDGKTIWIPPVEDHPKVRVLVNGYIDHEAGHVRSTDFKVGLRSLLPALERLVQCLEDIRQEGLMIRKFPGAKGNLNRLLEVIHTMGMHGDPETFNGFESVLFWMNNYLRLNALRMPASAEYEAKARKLIEHHLPGLPDRLVPLMTLVTDAEDTSEIVEIADSILDMLKDAFPETPPPPQQPESSDDSEDEEDQQCDQDEGAGESEEQSSSQPDTEDSDQPNDDSDLGDDAGQDSVDGAQDQNGQGPASDQGDTEQDGQTAKPDDDSNQTDTQAAAARQIAEQIRDPDADLKTIDLGDMVGSLIERDPRAPQEVEALPTYEIPPSQGSVDGFAAQAASGQIRARLASLLQAHAYQPSLPGRRGRKIDDRLLSRVAVGDDRIFVDAVRTKLVDTYVHLLVDLSDSMNDQTAAGDRYVDVAMLSAYSLAIGLQSIPKVSREVTAFSGPRYGIVSIVKVGQPARAERFLTNAGNGTPLANALMAIAPNVALARQARRIVVVLTDGDPDDPQAAQEVIDLYSRTGIEIVGVGIQTMAVSMFPRHIVINDVSELSGRLQDLLGDLLVSAA